VPQPNFFIAGAAKCGTTAMHEYLSGHPEIFMSDHKEPHFFGSDLEWFDREPMTRDHYDGLFLGAGQESIVGESSIFYVYSTLAAEEIREAAPDAKILIMLRNPVDMIYSFHSQRVFNGTEDLADFAVALDAEEDRRAGNRLPKNVGLLQGLYYSELGRFDVQVERFQTAFPKDQIQVLLYDDFRRDTLAAYRSVLNFLGVDDGYAPDFEVINPNTVNRNQQLQRLMAGPPAGVQKLYRTLVPNPQWRLRIGEAIRSFNTRVERRDTLSDSVRTTLSNRLRPSIERLETLIDRDLSAWKVGG